MKPPLRASSHSTSRMPITRASMMRPEDVEAHQVADADAGSLVDALLDRDLQLFGIGGQRRLPAPERPRLQRFVRLEMVAIRDDELAAEPPRRRTSATVSRLVSLAANAGHPGPQHWNQSRLGSGRA